MTTRKAPAGGWARLSAGIIHDSKWLEQDAGARLVFFTSIALAKSANLDGQISLRSMIGIQWGAMTPDEVTRAAQDLVVSGLWTATGDPDRYIVTRFIKWNETRAEQANAKARKRIGALRTNHRKGQHAGATVDDCPDCYPQGTTHPSAIAGAVADREPRSEEGRYSGPLASARRDGDQTRRDETPPTPPNAPGSNPNHPDVVDVADKLIEILGLVDEPSNTGERRYVARAIGLGWDITALEDWAHEAAGKDGIGDVRDYFQGGLRRRANEPPPKPTPQADDFRLPTIDELIANHHDRYNTTTEAQR